MLFKVIAVIVNNNAAIYCVIKAIQCYLKVIEALEWFILKVAQCYWK